MPGRACTPKRQLDRIEIRHAAGPMQPHSHAECPHETPILVTSSTPFQQGLLASHDRRGTIIIPLPGSVGDRCPICAIASASHLLSAPMCCARGHLLRFCSRCHFPVALCPYNPSKMEWCTSCRPLLVYISCDPSESDHLPLGLSCPALRPKLGLL